MIRRIREWWLERRIKRAEDELAKAPRHLHRYAWERAARLHLKRRKLDPGVRVHLEAMLERGRG